MQDPPRPGDIVAAVAALLSNDVLPTLSGRLAYDVRVAINALHLVSRELALAPAADASAAARLKDLLGQDALLEQLNAVLGARLRAGSIDPSEPQLIEHLWRTTMDKLAIDQPSYEAFRVEAARRRQGQSTPNG